MKKSCLISVLLVLALVLVSCTTSKTIEPTTTAKIIWDSSTEYSSQTEFAVNELKSAFNKANIALVDEAAIWTIELVGLDETLGEESYSITVDGNNIKVVGGDRTGLMYGGLEVATCIGIGGLESVTDRTSSPSIEHRSIMYHLTLDMRTPTYNTPADAGQKNIENVWDLDFWKEFFDEMARNRYNIIFFKNLNLFASMIEVEGYEDVALDDVWRTTVPFDNSYSGDCIDMVRPEHWENYEVVKKMTMDEKIAFWREVMAYAKSRGIGTFFSFAHIYTFAEQGKYGITNDIDNPITKDYFKKSVKTFLETYPDIIGLDVSPGENMGWSNTTEGFAINMQWLHDVYVPAINEVISNSEGREFDFILDTVPSQTWVDMYSDCPYLRGFRCTDVHFYSSNRPGTFLSALAVLPEGMQLYPIFRNEDCFNMRWGDPDFVRSILSYFPTDGRIYGFMTGSDGYTYGRDYSSTDSSLQGQLYMQKHWYNYMLWGNLTFNPSLTDSYLYQMFDSHLSHIKDTKVLFDATSKVGKIIPQISQLFYRANGDYTWFAEGNWTHPNTFGYIDIKSWMRSTNIYPNAPVMPIEDYALALFNNEAIDDQNLDTPVEISERLKFYAQEALDAVSQIREEVKKSKKLSPSERDYWCLVEDDEAMAYLGLFYSEKILGAIDLRLFNETKDESDRANAVKHLENSLAYFEKYAQIISKNYVPQQLARVGSYNVLNNLEEVKKDIEIAKTWKPRVLPRSTNAPSKAEFFSKSN